MGALTRVREAIRRDRTPEVRDPKAATKALRWVTPGRAQPPDWDARVAFERAYYANVVTYACVQRIARDIARLPFRAGVDPGKPNDYDTNAPLARLLGPPPGGPAPKLSARRLWAWTTGQRLVTGRNGWEIEANDRGYPAALWPLASSSLLPVPTQSGSAWWQEFVYGRQGDQRHLRPEMVVYDWDPAGTDFRQAESALEAAHLDVNVAVMQSRYDYAFLRNDARPPAIVVTEEFEDQDSFEAFKRQFNSEHAGPDNAGKIAFAEAKGSGDQGVKGAIDVQVLGFSPKDAQAAQRHASAMERIAIALGVPWSLLDASGRTFDNASQEWMNYVRGRLLAMLTDFADMVNMQLAPLFNDGKVGWFDLSDLGLEDWERLDPAGAAALYQAGIITKDEARAPFGLQSTQGGDAFVAAPEPVVPPARSVEPEDRGGESEPRSRSGDESQAGQGSCLAPAPAPEQRGLTAEEQEVRRARIWTSANATVRNLERIWEKAWRRMFARQERAAIARLEAKRGRNALTRMAQGETRALPDEVFDVDHWTAETEDEARALYEQVVAAGGARVSALFGIAFDLEAPYAQEFVHARANQLAGPVTRTTYEAIQTTLGEGVQAGESIPDLSTRIRSVFSDASASRATTIARTEVISAFNGSAVTVASQLGSEVVAGKEWIATRDGRTREWHAERDGEIVAVVDVFSGGIAYPGDGPADEVVNCRCTVAFLTPDEMAEHTADRTAIVDVRTARAVLAMVTPGASFDEQSLRLALRAAA